MRVLKLAAVLLTTLALIPSGAHFFELFNKIGLPEAQCFVVQGIYRGWAFFGYVWLAAMIVDFALAVALWRRGERAWPAVIAGVLIATPSQSSLHGSIRRIGQRRIGRRSQLIGSGCAQNGNMATPPMPC
jgi:hypothetical protein